MTEKSMRDALSEAFDKKNEDEIDEEVRGSEEDTEEPVGDPGEEEGEGEGSAKEEVDEPEDEGDEGSEEDGKPDQDASEDDKGGDGSDRRDASDETVDKAPASWKPAIREHWAKLPKEVRAEIARREQEIEKGLFQASGAKRLANEYYNLVRPYEHLIRAKNSTPAQAITNLMQTAAGLQMGTKAQKAQIVANILKEYDVDIQTLDQILAGQKPKDDDTGFRRVLDEELKPIKSFLEQVQGSRSQQEQEAVDKASREIEAFANDPKNEFFKDLEDEIADIMELAANRGRPMSLKDAYDRACRLNPDISKILDQRREVEQRRLSAEAAQKKRKAASSVKGARSEESGRKTEGGDIRSALSQAWDDILEAQP